MGVFSIIRISLGSVIPYLVGRVSYEEFIVGWLERLILHNILCVKIFQALSGNTEEGYFSKVVIDVFTKQTNNTSYVEEDIERNMVDQIAKAYELVLDDPMPGASGMVALVFFARGKNDGKRYVLKTKRRNIKDRIRRGHAEFVSIYNVIRRISKVSSKMRDSVNSLRSLADTRDYILTQCEFDEEINALRCTRREFEPINDCVVFPMVYNDTSVNLDGGYSHTDYILMEHFDGEGITDLSANDKELVFSHICKYVGMNTCAKGVSYIHADMHPGNIICMERDGTKVLGVIDFGMNQRMDNDLRGLAFGMYAAVAEKVRHPNKHVDVMKRCPMLTEPRFTDDFFEKLSDDQYNKMNNLFLDTLIGLSDGEFDENKMHAAMRVMNQCLDGTTQYILAPKTFKLLMAQSMIFSVAIIAVPDKKKRSKMLKKAMLWATSEF